MEHKVHSTAPPGDPADELLPLTALRHPRLTGMYQYWDAKRAGRTMPARADLRPEEMSFSLGYLCLVEVEQSPRRRFRFRLVGTAIANAYGRDLSHCYLDEVRPEAYRAIVERHYGQATEQRRPQLHRVQYWEGTERLHRLLRLTLPLSDDGDTVNMLLLTSVFGQDLASP